MITDLHKLSKNQQFRVREINGRKVNDKYICELGYRFAGSTSDMYYDHLHILCDKYKINLYGDKI
jgi:hypothetical protein